MSTDTYRKKRDFSRSPEPSGRRGGNGRQPRFVIQRHDASNEHYDFRLEADGVLKSWAVPRGPSTDPREKRLAVEVEDHPLDYADFEGVIPEGEYGAGTVMVWDRGTYDYPAGKDEGTQESNVAAAIKSGHLVVNLRGEKLRGGYALQRMRGGKKPQWLLVKINDDQADARRNPVSTQGKSVLSGRTLKQIAREEKDTAESR